MPIHGYPGGVISATAPTISPTSASGVWTLDDQLQNAANWPSQSNIARSLRFNSADSATLSRTPVSSGNRRTWTTSFWVKRSTLGYKNLLNCSTVIGSSADELFQFTFDGSDRLYIFQYNNSTVQADLITTSVYRDVSAWYHIVVAYDTTQATASNRIKLYVNGVQVTAFSTATYPTQNLDGYINHTVPHVFGRYASGGSPLYFDGYIADFYMVDGQALTPSSFGYTDSNGIWQPNSYTGSYGTNGFWLNFDDNSGTTSTTLGKDSSGNGNNWTPNNFSVTAGAGNDSLVDSPTNYGTDTGVGGEVRGNYATLNPLANNGGTLANGNLDHTGTTAITTSTLFPTTGKWYCELTCTAYGGGGSFGYTAVGVIQSSQSINTIPNSIANVPVGLWIYRNDGIKANNGASASYGSTWTANDVIGIAIDIDAGKVWFAKNNTWQSSGDPAVGTNAAYTNLSGAIGVAINDQGSYSSSYAANFGQRPFAYAAPAGFKALCSTNLPTPTIQKGADYFNPVLYTGDGNATAQAITGTGFQPDWVWIKSRSNTYVNLLFDAVRGAGKQLISELANAESTVSNFVSFDSNGFTVNAAGGASSYNANGATYVAWNWKANGTGVSNTAGSITSTVSANQTAGFSIVTYTGTGANATVGHGLGAAPQMIIIKTRSASYDWLVYHTSIGNTAGIFLNLSNAPTVATAYFNNTSPTSSVFSLGSSLSGNSSGTTLVAYCFAAVSGFSAFGQYTGNGSTDGPFIYTGFRPAYLLIKRSNDGADWYVYDAKRNTYNALNSIISPDLSSAEATNAAYAIDFTANGFKLRLSTTYANSNASTYIYAAFAENPFKIARAR